MSGEGKAATAISDRHVPLSRVGLALDAGEVDAEVVDNGDGQHSGEVSRPGAAGACWYVAVEVERRDAPHVVEVEEAVEIVKVEGVGEVVLVVEQSAEQRTGHEDRVPDVWEKCRAG